MNIKSYNNMSTLETQYKNWKEKNVDSLYTFEEWKERILNSILDKIPNPESDNMYYTPDLEDLHVGYKCERIKKYEKENDKWEKWFIPSSFNLDYVFRHQSIRTKYLTKEDIESEGWVYNNKENHFVKRFVEKDKDGDFIGSEYRLQYSNISKNLYIESLFINEDTGEGSYDLYEGNQNHILKFGFCPSINEFKYITKELLNIQ